VAYKLDWLIYKKKLYQTPSERDLLKGKSPKMGEKLSEPGRDSNSMPPGVPATNGLKGYPLLTYLNLPICIEKFRQLQKKAELPKIRFHDLRHTAVSLMLNNGVDVFVASKRLGHAKPSIALDVYGHLLSSVQNEVADKMDSLLSI
jgi:integrase